MFVAASRLSLHVLDRARSTRGGCGEGARPPRGNRRDRYLGLQALRARLHGQAIGQQHTTAAARQVSVPGNRRQRQRTPPGNTTRGPPPENTRKHHQRTHEHHQRTPESTTREHTRTPSENNTSAPAARPGLLPGTAGVAGTAGTAGTPAGSEQGQIMVLLHTRMRFGVF